MSIQMSNTANNWYPRCATSWTSWLTRLSNQHISNGTGNHVVFLFWNTNCTEFLQKSYCFVGHDVRLLLSCMVYNERHTVLKTSLQSHSDTWFMTTTRTIFKTVIFLSSFSWSTIRGKGNHTLSNFQSLSVTFSHFQSLQSLFAFFPSKGRLSLVVEVIPTLQSERLR